MDPDRTSREELLEEVAALRLRIAEMEAERDREARPEEDLREVAARYRSFVENITNVFYSHTADHILTYMSPQTKDLLNMEPEEALIRWTDLATDDPVNERGLEIVQRAIDTGERQEPYELELKRKGGGTVWVEVHEAPVVRGGKTVGIVGALTDISQRKRMEGLLRVELAVGIALSGVQGIPEALQLVLDAALGIDEVDGGGVYFVDETTGALELVCHKGLGENFVAAISHVAAGNAKLRQATEAGAGRFMYSDALSVEEGLTAAVVFPVTHEGRLIACLNAASRHVDQFPTCVLDALETIASLMGPAVSRVRAEMSLKQSEATLRGVFRAVPAAIGIVTGPIFRWVNEYMARMTGYSERELTEHSARMLYDSDDECERVGREGYGQIDRTGTGSVETRWIRRDGRAIDMVISSSILDPANPAMGVVFTAWEVTKRKRAEEEKRRLEARVQHAQNLESLGVLAGGIAHDFNNILQAIQGNTDVAAGRIPADAEAHDALREICVSVERAGGLCNQLLAYSGKGSFVVRRMDLGEVASDVASMLRVSMSRKTVLSVEVAPHLPAIDADVSQIRQVLVSLITNASEAFEGARGMIVLLIAARSYDRAELDAAFPGDDVDAGAFVQLNVSDTGCGMDEKTLRRVFEPFFTTKFAGRGLGMAAVQGIVRGHRGGVRFVSEKGRGTTATVIFPVAEGPAEVQPVVVSPRYGRRGSGTILFADDEPALRDVGEAILTDAGFAVITASDGREAVDLYREHASEITCVVLDLTMPGMDGAEALCGLRAIRPDAPVVLSSGYSVQDIRDRFADEAPSAFLQKPFSADRLLQTLDEVLGFQ